MILAVAALAGALSGHGSPAAASDERAQWLASFDRAWERIRDTYYDPAMRGVDWNAVRTELRPKAEAAKSLSEARDAIETMLSRLGESHFALLPREVYGDPRGGDGGSSDAPPLLDDDDETSGDLGFAVRVVETSVLVTRVEPGSPADQAGLRTGWVLRRIGSLDVDELLARSTKAMSDGKLARLHVVQGVRLAELGSAKSIATLELNHGGGQGAILDIERRAFPGEMNTLGNLPPVPVEFEKRMLPGGAGYIRFNIFLAPVAQPFADAVSSLTSAGASGIIVDVRGNPGGIGALVMAMAGRLGTRAGATLGTLRLRTAELKFVAIAQATGTTFRGPVAVLVDELSMSTSEIFAAGMKGTGSARIFGERTAGMALPSIIEELPNGDRLQFVTADLTGPDGTRIEGHGVVPDEPIALTRAALLSGGDPVVAAAEAWIASKATAPVR